MYCLLPLAGIFLQCLVLFCFLHLWERATDQLSKGGLCTLMPAKLPCLAWKSPAAYIYGTGSDFTPGG